MRFWSNIILRIGLAVFAAVFLWVLGLCEKPVLPLCTLFFAWLWLLSRSPPNGDSDEP
jgi:hypothetical protein